MTGSFRSAQRVKEATMPVTMNGQEEKRVTDQELNSFVMPRPDVGDVVRWYRFGVANESQASAATVTRILDSSIDVSVILGGAKFAVRHINDPRLKMSSDMRAEGAWDFTAKFYKDLARDSEFDQRLRELEDRLEPASTSSLNDLWELRRSVKELAGKGWQKLNKEECEALLAAKAN